MKKLTNTILLLLIFSVCGFSQPGKFQAVFIFNFYKQMDWPASYKNSDFVIGVIGESPVIPMLEKLTGGKTGKTRFVIAKFASVSEISKCNLVYIPNEKSELFEAVQKKIIGSATLVITEKPGLGGKGAAINFVQINDRLRFELNDAAIRKANVQVSDMLRSLAIVI